MQDPDSDSDVTYCCLWPMWQWRVW